MTPIGLGNANLYVQDKLGDSNRFTVNIGSSLAPTNINGDTLTIGSSLSTTNFNGNNVINTANASANGTSVNLYTTNTTGIISIGGADGANSTLVSIPCNTIFGRTVPASVSQFYGTTIIDTLTESINGAVINLYTANTTGIIMIGGTDGINNTLIMMPCNTVFGRTVPESTSHFYGTTIIDSITGSAANSS